MALLHQRILAFETSCDETAATVYDTTTGVMANVLYSQIALHAQYGGVVPEIASRSHLEKINTITQSALDTAKTSLAEITTIAVTCKPGLPGSLLVGLCFAKALARTLDKPLIGVNHLEGHIYSACIENTIPFPFLCLTASGGHTALYRVDGFGDYTVIGHTTDDAAGEAFDKVAKLMGLPYPGGPIIEKLAAQVDYEDFFHYPRLKDTQTLDFSFSGLKTAVLYDLVKRGAYDLKAKKFLAPDEPQPARRSLGEAWEWPKNPSPLIVSEAERSRIYAGNTLNLQQQVSSSLLACVGDIFTQRLLRALDLHPDIQAVAFVGGVACNKYLRNRLKNALETREVPLYTPSPQYCTDNAAMIAFVAHYKAQQGKFDDYTLDIY